MKAYEIKRVRPNLYGAPCTLCVSCIYLSVLRNTHSLVETIWTSFFQIKSNFVTTNDMFQKNFYKSQFFYQSNFWCLTLCTQILGNYEPLMNCQWMVFGEPGKVLKLTFTTFNIEQDQNDTLVQCWDYVEVRHLCKFCVFYSSVHRLH